MKLVIKRSQKERKGVFGGHKGMTFLLSCRVELTPEEHGLVTKYKAEKELLAGLPIGEGGTPVPIYIDTLLAGYSHECEDVTSLLESEDKIKRACEGFKTLLAVMASFGGEEVIEF